MGREVSCAHHLGRLRGGCSRVEVGGVESEGDGVFGYVCLGGFVEAFIGGGFDFYGDCDLGSLGLGERLYDRFGVSAVAANTLPRERPCR